MYNAACNKLDLTLNQKVVQKGRQSAQDDVFMAVIIVISLKTHFFVRTAKSKKQKKLIVSAGRIIQYVHWPSSIIDIINQCPWKEIGMLQSWGGGNSHCVKQLDAVCCLFLQFSVLQKGRLPAETNKVGRYLFNSTHIKHDHLSEPYQLMHPFKNLTN